jgi:hypothetical protein
VLTDVKRRKVDEGSPGLVKASRTTGRKRPFVYVNVATTADGKLAPANRQFVPFSSKHDRELLLELRTRADAVMAGARTVDLAKTTLGPGAPRFRRLRLGRGLAEYSKPCTGFEKSGK